MDRIVLQAGFWEIGPLFSDTALSCHRSLGGAVDGHSGGVRVCTGFCSWICAAGAGGVSCEVETMGE